MVNKITRTALLLVLVISISACGFHLRGNIPLPDGVKNMFISAPEGPFKEQLESAMIRGGATISATQAGADVVLVVTNAATDRRVGTLDDRGKVNSYDLFFKVAYSLNDPQGESIRPSKTLVETRRYNFEPENVVETEAEEIELQESMEEDISLRIVRQLTAVTDYTPGQAVLSKPK